MILKKGHITKSYYKIILLGFYRWIVIGREWKYLARRLLLDLNSPHQTLSDGSSDFFNIALCFRLRTWPRTVRFWRSRVLLGGFLATRLSPSFIILRHTHFIVLCVFSIWEYNININLWVHLTRKHSENIIFRTRITKYNLKTVIF